MRRVLVTGATGFIGRHTLAPLVAAGYEVHALSSRPLLAGAPAGALAVAGVHWHSADLFLPGVEMLIDRVKPTHLLHFAWNARPGEAWTTLENLDWVGSSLALLRAFGEAGGLRVVVAGTCAEYMWERETHCVEGLTPTSPVTLYGAAKHALQVVADAWATQAGVSLAWGRVFFVYGPHEYPARLVSGVARALLRGEVARCTHGRQVRDFLYTPDLGAAFAALLDSEVAGPLNMASGEALSIAEVVGAVANAAGRPELLCLGALPANPGEPERLTADVRRLREEVCWNPTIPPRVGIERTVEWWRKTLAEEGPETRPSR